MRDAGVQSLVVRLRATAYALPAVFLCCGAVLLLLAGTGRVAEGDEPYFATLGWMIMALAVVSAVYVNRCRLRIDEDGHLTLTTWRTRTVQLHDLASVRASLEGVRGWAGQRTIGLTDRWGDSVELSDRFPWQRGDEAWRAIDQAIARADIELSGVTRHVIADLAGVAEPRAGGLQRRRSGDLSYVAPAERAAAWLVGILGTVALSTALLMVMGGVFEGSARPVAIALLVGATIMVAIVVLRLASRRIRIHADGRLTMRGLVRTHDVQLLELKSVRLEPDRAVHTGVRPPTTAEWETTFLVLEDRGGRQIALPLSNAWGPAAPLFSRVLEATRRTKADVHGHAYAELRFLAGETTT